MKNNPILVIASVSGIFGIMMGVLGTAGVWLQTSANFTRVGPVARTEEGILTKEALLEQLRSGHYQEATRQIEAALDDDLVKAREFVLDGAEFSATTLKAIAKEREARGMYGYEPSSKTVNAMVQEMFHLAPRSEIAAGIAPVMFGDDTR